MLTELGAGIGVSAGEALARRLGGSCAISGADCVYGHFEAGNSGAVVPDGQDGGLDETATGLGEDVQQAVVFPIGWPHT